MSMKSLKRAAPLALASALVAGQAAPAAAQVPVVGTAPVQSPVAAGIAAATETRAATVREVYGVDNASSCDLLLPPGEANPVLFRRASAGGRDRMEIFAADTGLVLVGRDLALLQSAALRIDGGPVISGTIVRRRLAGSQCGETPGNGAGIAVLRFAIPARTSVATAMLLMRTRKQFPPIAFTATPCDPKAIGASLEGTTEKFRHCFPDAEYDVDPIPVTLVPRPRIASLSGGVGNTGTTSVRISASNTIPLLALVTGTALERVNELRHEVLAGSAPGIRVSDFTLGIAQPRFMLTWFNPVAGQTATGRVKPAVPMLRFPRGSGGAIRAARTISDSAWAGNAADALRSLGEGRYAITALAAAGGGGGSGGGGSGGGGTSTAPAAAIKAFDPGNLLFNSGGGTTTVDDSGTSATMVGLASESWCATVPQPSPAQPQPAQPGSGQPGSGQSGSGQSGSGQPASGPASTRVVAQGTANLPAIRWGVRNEGTAAFNGSIVAELRLRGRVVDTLTFSGALPAGGTEVRSFVRPVQQVTVARESLGPKCFYVGNPGDAVLENSAYDVKVTTPAADTKPLRSLP